MTSADAVRWPWVTPPSQTRVDAATTLRHLAAIAIRPLVRVCASPYATIQSWRRWPLPVPLAVP